MNKTALIIGANGQDASYMAEFLIEKGYNVHGTIRRNSVPESQTRHPRYAPLCRRRAGFASSAARPERASGRRRCDPTSR